MELTFNFRGTCAAHALLCATLLGLFTVNAAAQTTATPPATPPNVAPDANENGEPKASEDAAIETDDATTEDADARAVRALRDADPQRRQLAAETLARLAPRQHLRLVQGFRLQERDARVRLALDWALYRIGKPESLFGIVNALTSKRREQAIEYLARLDEPATLVALLKSPKREVKIGVLEALGRNGDERTAREIEPLVASSDIQIAAAVQLALTQIELRQGKRDAAPALPTRPRQVGQPSGGESNPH